MKGDSLRATVGLLSILVVAQVGLWGWQRWHRPLSLLGPLIGKPLPDVGIRMFKGGTAIRLTDIQKQHPMTCALVVVASAGCATCRRMRYSWGERFRIWRDSVGTEIGATWITAGDSVQVAEFYGGFTLGDATLGYVLPHMSLESLGVVGTPMTYLLDVRGTFRGAYLGDHFPSLDSGRTACQDT